jgi:large conductance mechanosensitive channel
MPSDVERQASERDALLERGARRVKRLWEGFVDFAFEGNVLQIAFGLMFVKLLRCSAILFVLTCS